LGGDECSVILYSPDSTVNVSINIALNPYGSDNGLELPMHNANKTQ
jgi:hypothetical protein